MKWRKLAGEGCSCRGIDFLRKPAHHIVEQAHLIVRNRVAPDTNSSVTRHSASARYRISLLAMNSSSSSIRAGCLVIGFPRASLINLERTSLLVGLAPITIASRRPLTLGGVRACRTEASKIEFRRRARPTKQITLDRIYPECPQQLELRLGFNAFCRRCDVETTPQCQD